MGQNTTWTYEDCARSTVIRDRTRYLRWSGVDRGFAQPSPSGPRPLPCGGTNWYAPREHAGRRHARPSCHTGGTGDNPLLTLVVRGHVKSPASSSSGLARPGNPTVRRVPALYYSVAPYNYNRHYSPHI